MRWFALCICLLWGVADLSPATAAPKRSAKKRAASYKKKAFKALSEGDYGKAIRLMNKAYDTRPHPGFLLNIAVAYDQWGGHCPQALDAFGRFFSACDETCSLAASGRERYDKVSAECPVPLDIVSSPGGATLVVNGQTKGLTPAPLELMPGTYDVSVSLDGYLSQQTKLELTHPGPGTLQLRLLPVPAKAAPPIEPPNVAPPPPPPPPAVVVEPAEAQSKRTLRPWAWTATGVAGAGAIVGGIFTGLSMKALSDEKNARELPQTRREIESLQDTAISRAWVANIGFGVAIGSAALATALFLLDDPQEEAAP